MIHALLSRLRAVRERLYPTPYPDEWQLLPALTTDADGWLVGEGVTRIASHPSWYYAKLSTPDGEPDAVVAHYSATDAGTAESMARRRQRPWSEFAADWRQTYPDKAVPQNSWHASIETYGGIVQMAPFTSGTWHAGSPTAKPIKGVGWANRTAIGVELIGHGKAFPQAQVIDAARLWAALVDRYGIARKHAMVTHQELDPGRRSDPGPVWMSKHAPRVLAYAFAR